MKIIFVLIFQIEFILSLTTFLTDRPVLGILTSPLLEEYPDLNFPEFSEVLHAKNMHFIEAGSGRLFPISYQITKNELLEILPKINGILIPDSNINPYLVQNEKIIDFSKYTKTVKLILELVKEKNIQGIYFPIFAVSRGFEILILSESEKLDILEPCYENQCKNYNVNLEILNTQNFTENFLQNKFISYENTLLTQQNLVFHNHFYKITLKKFLSDSYLSSQYKILSITPNRGKIVSTIQHKNYPIYGTLYNPGVWIYEWDEKFKIVKNIDTIFLGLSFANFFISECRKNDNKFIGGYQEELQNIIESKTQINHPEYGHLYLFN